MNENMELMMHVYEASEMGVYSTTCLINELKNKDNKIKTLLQSELKGYESFLKISKKILTKYSIELPTNSLMTKISSSFGIKMETIKDNSDSALASMLIEGFTMGIVEIESKLDKYKKICEKKYIKICKEFINFQGDEISKLKAYL